jgi:hypothetical protein
MGSQLQNLPQRHPLGTTDLFATADVHKILRWILKSLAVYWRGTGDDCHCWFYTIA